MKFQDRCISTLSTIFVMLLVLHLSTTLSLADTAKEHSDRAVELSKKGDLEGSVAEFRETIRLQPGFAMAHRDLGMVLYMKRDKQSAPDEMRKASQLAPNDTRIRRDCDKMLSEIKKQE